MFKKINFELIEAAMYPGLNNERIQELLELGAELHPTDGTPPALQSAVGSHVQHMDPAGTREISDEEIIENCKVLIAHKADVNSADMMGWTPLTDAVFRRSADIVKFLLSQGAIITTTDKFYDQDHILDKYESGIAPDTVATLGFTESAAAGEF